MENLKMHTPDLAAENFKKLAALFPNAVTENITVTATFKTKPAGFGQTNQQSTINNQKLMINGQLFIQRGDELFNAQGTRVK